MNGNRLPLVTYEQAVMLEHLGFNRSTDFAYYDCPNRHETQISTDLQDALEITRNAGGKVYKRPNLYDSAKWLREELGIDIVVGPKIDMESRRRTGGYFWQWLQLGIDIYTSPTIQDTFEDSLSDAITYILEVLRKQLEMVDMIKNMSPRYIDNLITPESAL